MKYFSIIAAVLVLFSSTAAIGFSKEADDVQKLDLSIAFTGPILNNVVVNGISYLQVTSEDSFGMIKHAGEPLLPRKVQTFELPFGTRICDVTVETSSTQTMILSSKILPAPKPVIQGSGALVEYEMSSVIYESDEYYPLQSYSIHTSGGLNVDNEHTTFVTIESFPVQYNPVTNSLKYHKDLTITVTYQEPSQPLITMIDEFDMVIITPETFADDLGRLVNHKVQYGVNTFIKTTEEIFNEYTGVDEPEQIKMYIKDAIETSGVKYVMLIGGLKSPIWAIPRDDANQGTKHWLLPVRYTNLKEQGTVFDPGYISDLYYADIYDANGSFSSWDKDKNGNSDGIFAVWTASPTNPRDVIDLSPDVYVGRLPCRNKMELGFMIDKIITYETETFGSEWFSKMIGIGGDSHDDGGTNYLEGEVVCDTIFEMYMSDFTPVKIYASQRTTNPDLVPSDTNMIREISKGVGFLLFDGHGSPGSWNTHWPGIFNWDDTPGGISCYDFSKFENGGKYPICVVGGCHNSQYNISLIPTALNRPFTWAHGVPYMECFGEHMMRKKDGGSIASFGNTGLGYGTIGEHGDLDGDGINLPDPVEALGGYQEAMFFKSYAEGVNILGETWGGSIRNYLNAFPGMADQTDCKTVQQWPLLGDPSLKIGGYE
ncbi:MAG: C25 family cysteine peptidase [Thermoplasmatota archaeon]